MNIGSITELMEMFKGTMEFKNIKIEWEKFNNLFVIRLKMLDDKIYN